MRFPAIIRMWRSVPRGHCFRQADRGLLLCGTGVGMSIAANKIPGVYAAHCHDVETARFSRRHNNANVLTMGARILSQNLHAK